MADDNQRATTSWVNIPKEDREKRVKQIASEAKDLQSFRNALEEAIAEPKGSSHSEPQIYLRVYHHKGKSTLCVKIVRSDKADEEYSFATNNSAFSENMIPEPSPSS